MAQSAARSSRGRLCLVINSAVGPVSQLREIRAVHLLNAMEVYLKYTPFKVSFSPKPQNQKTFSIKQQGVGCLYLEKILSFPLNWIREEFET